MLTASLENIKNEIERIGRDLSTVDLVQLDEKITGALKEIDTVFSNITEKSRIQEQIEQTKKEADNQIMDLNMAVSKLQGQQNEILAQWKESGLFDIPTFENLNDKRKSLITQADSIKHSPDELNKMSEELGPMDCGRKI